MVFVLQMASKSVSRSLSLLTPGAVLCVIRVSVWW